MNFYADGTAKPSKITSDLTSEQVDVRVYIDKSIYSDDIHKTIIEIIKLADVGLKNCDDCIKVESVVIDEYISQNNNSIDMMNVMKPNYYPDFEQLSSFVYLSLLRNGLDPDNYCIVAMNETEGTAIPLHGVSTETTPNGLLLNVQVGGIGPLDKPGTLMVAHGEGKFVDLQEEVDRLNGQLFGSILAPAWHWQAGQGVPALVQKFKLKIHPSFNCSPVIRCVVTNSCKYSEAVYGVLNT